MVRFLVVVQAAGENFSAYCPDLPGCVATGAARDEAEENMYEAMQLHPEGMRQDGLAIPPASAVGEHLVFPTLRGAV